ncbi:MAG TPA: alpha/beta hydrolase [Longimicrobium sp.]|jgi:sigma-B regulation protein RsbQ|uniref:alpha/beta fold hydrolase n=1 Tax=Longimicrobium sp. TaxID=2029185 RepID=UPI002ED93CCD
MHPDIRTRNNVLVAGRGTRPMVFAHGFGCDQNMWRAVTPAFEDDYQVVTFDYVGSGRSDVAAYSADRYGSLNGYAQDLLDVCHALELRDVILVGHSVSSMVGVLASIREPGLFSRLVMVAPSPRYINDEPDYVGGFERRDIEGLIEMMSQNHHGWANFLAPVVMRNEDRPGLAEELEASFCAADPEITRRFAEVTFYSDNRADLPHVTVPSLLLQCSDDLVAPAEVGDFLHRSLAGSTLVHLKATGHCPHMSHPEETVAAIRAYLATVP